MQRATRFITLCAGYIAVGIFATNVIVHVGTKPYIYNSIASAPYAEAVLIPGTALGPGSTLSPIFTDRVNMAMKLYEAGKVSKILVSGDNSTVAHNEVDPVRLYLINKGIPDQDIFLDHAGLDTYSTMYRARDIFGVSSVLIASQSFHLPRAVFIARGLGMIAYGVSADTGSVLLYNYVREIFANEKAVFDLTFNRKPKYLGEKVPITGDGRKYP